MTLPDTISGALIGAFGALLVVLLSRLFESRKIEAEEDRWYLGRALERKYIVLEALLDNLYDLADYLADYSREDSAGGRATVRPALGKALDAYRSCRNRSMPYTRSLSKNFGWDVLEAALAIAGVGKRLDDLEASDGKPGSVSEHGQAEWEEFGKVFAESAEALAGVIYPKKLENIGTRK